MNIVHSEGNFTSLLSSNTCGKPTLRKQECIIPLAAVRRFLSPSDIEDGCRNADEQERTLYYTWLIGCASVKKILITLNGRQEYEVL